MTRAEEKSIVYQLATHGPNVMGGASVLSEDEYMRLNMNYDFKAGYEEAEQDLGWHSVDESLPHVDEEVIVLTDVVNNDYPENKIDGANFMCFGHIVDKMHCSDYNGWNIPGVKYWMPMPKLPEE